MLSLPTCLFTTKHRPLRFGCSRLDGFYLGGTLGGAWNDNSVDVATTNTFVNPPALSVLGRTTGPASAIAATGSVGTTGPPSPAVWREVIIGNSRQTGLLESRPTLVPWRQQRLSSGHPGSPADRLPRRQLYRDAFGVGSNWLARHRTWPTGLSHHSDLAGLRNRRLSLW